MVTVEKRGEKWRYRFDTAKVDGKRTRVSKGGFTSKTEALKAGTLAYAEYENTGRFIKDKETSVHDFYKEWLKKYAAVNVKPSTYKNYERIIRLYIDPAIGQYKIRNVTEETCTELITDLFNQGFSRNSLKTIKGVLKSGFAYAVSPLKLIKYNPVLAVKLPSERVIPEVPTRTKERTVISKEEFERISGRFPPFRVHYLPLQLGYRCGLRLGEVFGLCVEDFNEEAHTLTIRHQMCRNKENDAWCLEQPKYNSVRTIDLDDFTYALLKNRIEEIRKEQKTDGYKWFYLDKRGNITEKETSREFHPINRRKSGVPVIPSVMTHCAKVIHHELLIADFDFHSLRHTHASNLLANGADVVYVQRRLGHKNVEVTLNIYAHVTEMMSERNKNILNQL
jgi:integrase